MNVEAMKLTYCQPSPKSAVHVQEATGFKSCSAEALEASGKSQELLEPCSETAQIVRNRSEALGR